MTVVFAGSLGTAAEAKDLREALTIARIDDWMTRAQPGARLRYGMGRTCSEAAGEGVAERMRSLHRAGLVMLFAPRVKRPEGWTEFPFDFLAVRTSVLLPPRFPTLPLPAATLRKVTTIKVPGRKE